MKQMTISDWVKKAEPKNSAKRCTAKKDRFIEFLMQEEPICYSCQNALKRGRFRLCKSKGDGYKNVDQKPLLCHWYKEIEDDS